MGDVIEFDKAKQMNRPGGSIEGPLTAFYFSRKPRAERIAATVSEIIRHMTGGLNEILLTADGVRVLDLAKELEPYALKDFAVRYGHLEDGHAKP